MKSIISLKKKSIGTRNYLNGDNSTSIRIDVLKEIDIYFIYHKSLNYQREVIYVNEVVIQLDEKTTINILHILRTSIYCTSLSRVSGPSTRLCWRGLRWRCLCWCSLLWF